jgi:transglutaminase-like putative cysteine protease
MAAVVASCLGSLALLPSYSDLGWIPAAIGAVLVVGIVAEVSRLVGLPRALAPLLAAAGLALYITAAFAHDQATLGFLPTHDARSALADLIRIGWHDINVLRAPVPTHRGIVLLTALGAGGVALVVDLIAVTFRRAALAGLPLLALFAVPAATVPGGVGWLPFLYVGTGYLILLLTDSTERVGRWGQPLGAGRRDDEAGASTRPSRAETAPLAAVGRRVGFAALGIAVVLPAAVPGLHPGLFGTRGGSGNGLGNGGNTVTTYNPITRIKRQLLNTERKPLFRYTTTDDSPGYFRMTALDRFDGETWTQGDLTAPADQRVSKGMPSPYGLSNTVPASQVQTEVRGTDNLSVPWLPLPYPAIAVGVDGDWRYDGDTRAVFSTQSSTKGRSWSVGSLDVEPSRADLNKASANGPSLVEENKALDPQTVPPQVVSLARDVTKGAKTPFERGLALQLFFQSDRFHYTTDVADGSDKNVIASFLRDGRGYCVQFSSTMALMARAVGIASRVAIGFTRGDKQKDGSYQVTTLHAHAWPELYLNGIGWLAFEPTPRSDGQAQLPAYTQAGQGDGSAATGPGSSPAPTNSASPGPNGLQGKQDRINASDKLPPGSPGDPSAPSSGGGFLPVWLLGLVVLGLLLIFPATGRWLTRRRRWAAAETDAARAHAAWRELGDDARDLGLSWRTDDSPRRAADRLAATTRLAGAEPALQRLAAAEERALYARTLTDVGDLTADHKQVRRALADSASWQQRLLAVAMPRSTVTTVLTVSTNAIADMLDLIDAGIAWLTRTLVPRRLRRT